MWSPVKQLLCLSALTLTAGAVNAYSISPHDTVHSEAAAVEAHYAALVAPSGAEITDIELRDLQSRLPPLNPTALKDISDLVKIHKQRLLLLFGGQGFHTFLGCLNCRSDIAISVWNPAGPFGSPESKYSIWNSTTEIGSEVSQLSPWSPYAGVPPVMIDSDGNDHGLLSVNKRHKLRAEGGLAGQLYKYHSFIRKDPKLWFGKLFKDHSPEVFLVPETVGKEDVARAKRGEVGLPDGLDIDIDGKGADATGSVAATAADAAAGENTAEGTVKESAQESALVKAPAQTRESDAAAAVTAPAAQTDAQPAVQPEAKPAAQPAVQPEVKPAAQPAATVAESAASEKEQPKIKAHPAKHKGSATEKSQDHKAPVVSDPENDDDSDPVLIITG